MQERAVGLQRWHDLMISNKEELAKITTVEAVRGDHTTCKGCTWSTNNELYLYALSLALYIV